MRLILKWLVATVSLLAVAYVIPGISVSGFYAALIFAAVLGLINIFIKPLLVLLTLPINIITLGLFTLVINALLFWLAGALVVDVRVASFSAAFLGSLLFWLIDHLLIVLFLGKGRHEA